MVVDMRSAPVAGGSSSAVVVESPSHHISAGGCAQAFDRPGGCLNRGVAFARDSLALDRIERSGGRGAMLRDVAIDSLGIGLAAAVA